MSSPRTAAGVAVERFLVPAGTTCAEAVVTARLPRGGPEAIVVVRGPDGKLRDLGWAPDVDTDVESGRPLRAAPFCAHVLAQAVQDLFPFASLEAAKGELADEPCRIRPTSASPFCARGARSCLP